MRSVTAEIYPGFPSDYVIIRRMDSDFPSTDVAVSMTTEEAQYLLCRLKTMLEDGS